MKESHANVSSARCRSLVEVEEVISGCVAYGD